MVGGGGNCYLTTEKVHIGPLWSWKSYEKLAKSHGILPIWFLHFTKYVPFLELRNYQFRIVHIFRPSSQMSQMQNLRRGHGQSRNFHGIVMFFLCKVCGTGNPAFWQIGPNSIGQLTAVRPTPSQQQVKASILALSELVDVAE